MLKGTLRLQIHCLWRMNEWALIVNKEANVTHKYRRQADRVLQQK